MLNIISLLEGNADLQAVSHVQGVTWVRGNGSLIAFNLADMVEQAQSNIEAIQLCTAFYISHAYNKVRPPRGKGIKACTYSG